MAGNWLKLMAILVLSGGVLGAGAEQALAQEEDEVEVLDTVVVTGRQIEEKLSAELAEYGHQVQVIQGETIEKMGFVDVNEALTALVPGMYVQSKGRGDYAKYTMNGNRNILWLMDGVRLNNRLFGSAYMDTLSINIIDRIEVLFGGEGLFYGTEATSGVINIITKKPTKERSGQVGVAYGSDELMSINGYVSDSIGDNAFLIFGSHEDFEGSVPFKNPIYEAENNSNRQKRGYDRTNFGLKYLREFGGDDPDRTFGLHLQRNSGDFEYGYINRKDVVNDRTEYVLTAKWDHDVTDNFSYYVKAYYHEWWTDYTQLELDGTPVFDKSEWGYEDWGLNILSSYKFDRGDELLVGIDYQNYWASDETMNIKAKHEEVYAPFVQFRPYFDFWPEWKVALGARYNYLKNNDSTVWNISSRMPFLEDKVYLRANVGTSFILPTAEDLFIDDDETKGNLNLKPEESFSATVGVGTNWEFGNLEVSGFMEDITDLIGKEENGDTYIDNTGKLQAVEVYQNKDGETKIRGYTLTGTLKPLESLSLTASYTRQKATVNGKEDKRSDIPEDFGNISLQWNDTVSGIPLGMGLFNRYVGTIPAYATSKDPQEYGEYWLTDASIFANLTEKSRVSLYLSNIFDKEYPSSLKRNGKDDDPDRFYYENPLGPPFSATLTYTYSF